MWIVIAGQSAGSTAPIDAPLGAAAVRSGGMTTNEEVQVELALVFEELIDLVGEAKQAAWTASSPERERAFEQLRTFIVQQAQAVDEAELRLGERPAWVRSPTGHQWRNIAAGSDGDRAQVVDAFERDLRATVDDIRRHAANLDGEARDVLVDVADGLARHLDGLRNSR
jgi:hypothetical protein